MLRIENKNVRGNFQITSSRCRFRFTASCRLLNLPRQSKMCFRITDSPSIDGKKYAYGDGSTVK